MSSGWLSSRRLRFDRDHSEADGAPLESAIVTQFGETVPDVRLVEAIERTQHFLLDRQHGDGYWNGELEGDTILESEYILLLTFLGRENSEEVRQAANYILKQQLPEGGWAIYPGGPLEISASVKSYWALKIAGHSPDADYMQRARSAILNAGGAERVNSFTRFYFALLGTISYDQCPAVPPELILIPKWAPFNIYEMSSWSRTILVPLSLMWSFRPVRPLPEELGIRELFVNSPEELPVTMDKSDVVDELSRQTWIDWDRLFRRLDRLIKLADRLRLRPFRKLAVRRATEWMFERFENSDGLGAIFPPIIWSVVVLKCLGYDDDSPEVQTALGELEKLSIRENDTLRLEPCRSPVWDTSITTLALRDSGIAWDHPAIQRAVAWMLSKEVRRKGDWSVRKPHLEPGGWYFEFNNEFYPDVDDTIMVLMALKRCLPEVAGEHWNTEFFFGADRPGDGASRDAKRNGHSKSPSRVNGSANHRSTVGRTAGASEGFQDVAAVISGRLPEEGSVCSDIEAITPMLKSMARGLRWVLGMQCKDGGWAAFDADIDRELFTRVPFADHNAMLDPSTPDITARVLEMLGTLDIPADHPAIQPALDFVWRGQEPDHCWQGRWGVNYIYGTWQVLVGLEKIGVPTDDPRFRAGAEWFKSIQQDCGGWGETPRTYDQPELRGQGTPTASQTAWALMGLMAAGEVHSETVRRGVHYLLETQNEDGTWSEEPYTGTGFPKVFYLKYHYYAIYFPLMALGRYATLSRSA